MDVFLSPRGEMEIYGWEVFINDWFFVIALVVLAVEFIRYAMLRKLTWNLLGDTMTNYITLGMFIAINLVLFSGFYIFMYFSAAQFAVFDIPINWATVLICVVLADLTYYWEHRFMHRVNIAWATHSAHHSSPHFNISVAYRFGPMDGLWPIFFHLPLVLLGFNPFIVFFAEVFVQVFQTILHTEAVKKLPKPIEAIMNTPSHHRVHHASNEQYLDSNYAGIFIIWDRMFGTFVREDESVVYGLVKPINSINPLVAFFHGFWRTGKNILTAKNLGDAWMYFAGTPDWQPKDTPSNSKRKVPAH
ncbi:MAG: sterol desaturase/sphingolipid hydroxylase (fatty acid hydroxylase superfamily) [Parvibaculaceae bacterium]|jgi:sterol desaturase/sphingolipid hydroxylase (fatty acid hydroxylase superfamily)